jgi:APA family basic amino acid/polyamine antiporter
MHLKEIFRKKRYSIEKDRFPRKLGLLDLTFLGIGAIIGAGIFVKTRQAAAPYAGPGIVLSFLLGALVIGISALVYAELCSAYPVSGSAYSYTYATLGEVVAWLVGRNLLVEYGIATSAVATGWSGYLRTFLEQNLVKIYYLESHRFDNLLFLQLQKEQGFGVDWSNSWIKPFSLAGLPSG